MLTGMDCASVAFSGHALSRMFERGLQRDAVLDVIRRGEIIAEYPDDRPYPSYLLLGFVTGEPLHVVVARDSGSRRCFVVTAYRPRVDLWSDDFKTRKPS